jgi:hypothetical protein
MNEEMLPRRLLARSQRLLATALRSQQANDRAITLERAARSFYERGPRGYAWLIPTLSK